MRAGPTAGGPFGPRRALAASFVPGVTRHAAGVTSRPDVVVILTDDQRWDELDILIEHYGRSARVPSFCAVRTIRWEYVFWQDGEEELFDLLADPFELESLDADRAYAARAATLHARLERLCSPPRPGFEP